MYIGAALYRICARLVNCTAFNVLILFAGCTVIIIIMTVDYIVCCICDVLT